MEDINWVPIQAVRGNGMLIEGKRIGLYTAMQMLVNGKIVNWGVSYLIISVDEWKILQTIIQSAPLRITYATGITPETATISRAFIRERKNLFPDELPFYLGTDTRWGSEEVSLTQMQTMCLDLYRWVESCCVS